MRWLRACSAPEIEQIREELPGAADNPVIRAILGMFGDKMNAAEARCVSYTISDDDANKARGEVLAYKYGTLVLEDLAKRVARHRGREGES